MPKPPAFEKLRNSFTPGDHMKLFGTERSHFTRKVRILLDLYGISYEFIDLGNIGVGDLEKFRNNPLMRVPVLEDGDKWIIESDYIAQYLVETYDKSDRYLVKTSNISDLNIRAVLNGIMAEEVSLIIARRTGVPVEKYTFFESAREAIEQGLKWLDQHSDSFDAKNPKFKEFHLVCAWEHISHYQFVPMSFPSLKRIVEEVGRLKSIAQSSPHLLTQPPRM